MSLYEKIKSLYPQLTENDFFPSATSTIILRDDKDGKGEYIESWSHPEFSKPSVNELTGD
jgi:hypothetical protein